ncbi:MFS transporter [Cryobacterium sp.]|jgi:hypothetical protein|uniref:MFS transporter n=1 Tax=Cryobacterium sp. TaxID=1926290 RepID=UPI00262349C8|nr:MFS transporter [Cryobacterium sp.]MCU1445253.1 hypothetical protein [Cryobacterium sp.]
MAAFKIAGAKVGDIIGRKRAHRSDHRRALHHLPVLADGLRQRTAGGTVAGQVLLSAGQISPTVILVAIGLMFLIAFILVERSRDRQMELDYSAIQSGVIVLPLSLAVLLAAAVRGRVFSRRFRPRSVILAGFAITVLGALAVGLLARDATSGAEFDVGLALIGFGAGTIASQNQNLIMSSVEPQRSNETSGVINTSQNIGDSPGTSLTGALILSVFVVTATTLIGESTEFSSSQQSQLETAVTSKAQIVSDAPITDVIADAPAEQQTATLAINAQARQTALTVVYAGLALAGLAGFGAALRLPRTPPLSQRPAAESTDA